MSIFDGEFCFLESEKKTMFSDPFWESVSFLLIHINLFPIIIEKS